MFAHLKSVLQQIGQGLTAQHMGEMSATVKHIEKRCKTYHSAGGQSRIVLIASTDLTGPAFDFVVAIAKQTRSLIEVLYIAPGNEANGKIKTLLIQLSELSCDFQVTFLTGDLFEKVSNYSSQREDVMSVVCSCDEPFTESLKTATYKLEPAMRFTFPTILFISNSVIMA
jgi:hypothetical protein